MRMHKRPTMRTDSQLRPKRATNVSLSAALVAEARALGISVSSAAETGLKAEISRLRAAEWRQKNKDAIETWNRYVEEYGVPLAEFRQF